MKIKCLVGTVASGVVMTPGKDYEVSDRDGNYLCNVGKAEHVDKPAAKEKGLNTKTGPAVQKGAGK